MAKITKDTLILVFKVDISNMTTEEMRKTVDELSKNFSFGADDNAIAYFLAVNGGGNSIDVINPKYIKVNDDEYEIIKTKLEVLQEEFIDFIEKVKQD